MRATDVTAGHCMHAEASWTTCLILPALTTVASTPFRVHSTLVLVFRNFSVISRLLVIQLLQLFINRVRVAPIFAVAVKIGFPYFECLILCPPEYDHINIRTVAPENNHWDRRQLCVYCESHCDTQLWAWTEAPRSTRPSILYGKVKIKTISWAA